MVSLKDLNGPVLVTGGCGFIGKRVVKKLIDLGVEIKVLALKNEEIPKEWEDKVQIVRGKIEDKDAVENAVKGVKNIIHLAAVVSDWGDEKLYWDITVEGSRKIYEQALINDSKVVLASSIVVYGEQIGQETLGPKTGYGKIFGPYSKTKQAQEKLAIKYHREKNMKLSIIRPANVYGPESGTWLKDVLDVLKKNMGGLISGGNMDAGLVYVDNVADILILAAAEVNKEFKVYNAYDSNGVTWKRYFTDIADIIGVKHPISIPYSAAYLGAFLMEKIWRLLNLKKRPPITLEALNLIGSDNRFLTDNVKDDLGYEPQIDYAQGLKKIKDYLIKEKII